MENERSYLLIGAGNMAQPIYQSLIQNPANNLTVICGNSEGKNTTSVKQNLGGVPDNIQLYSRDEIPEKLNKIPKPETVIYAGKAGYMAKVMEGYNDLIDDHTVVAHICPGITVGQTQAMLSAEPQVIRVMPHLAKRVYGVYAHSHELAKQAESLFSGLGRPIYLPDEEAMHAFIAVAGSSPAFVAEFLRQQPDIVSAKIQLQTIAQGNKEEAPPESLAFYQKWCDYATEHFGQQGQEIVNQTLLGTLEVLGDSPEEMSAFIESVRSKKGTTNAGLILMGNPPPMEEGYGNAEQLKAQQKLAEKQQNQAAHETITLALEATAKRSMAMAYAADDPMAGLGGYVNDPRRSL